MRISFSFLMRRWHILFAWVLLLLTMMPSAIFILEAPIQWSKLPQQIWHDQPLQGSLLRSLNVLSWTSVISFIIGWPLGVMIILSSRTCRLFAWALLIPAVLCPTFLWAVGVHGWKGWLPYAYQSWLDGKFGLVLACSFQATLIVALLINMLTGWVTSSERQACLLIQGRNLLLYVVLKLTMPVGMAASLIAGVLVMGDAGAPQLMGYHTFASEIHIALASAQPERASLRMITALLALLPLAFAASWLLENEVRYRVGQARSRSRSADSESGDITLPNWLTLSICVILSGLMMLGVCLPLLKSVGAIAHMRDALAVLNESAGASMIFAVPAFLGVLAVSLPLGWAALDSHRVLIGCIIGQVLLLACPSPLHSAGTLQIYLHLGGKGWPELAQGALVGAAAMIRLLPLTGIVLAVWLRLVPQTWKESANIANISTLSFLSNILLPLLWRPLVMLSLFCGLLCLADVSGGVLLQPPGMSSYPMRLFALMDNAPAAEVSALCLVYWLIPLLVTASILGGNFVLVHMFRYFRE